MQNSSLYANSYYQSRFAWHLLATALFILGTLSSSYAESGPERIGVVIPLSGKSAEYGQFIREGLELARAETGPIEVLYEDDQCAGPQGVAATQKLLDVENVSAIYGSWCSSVVLAQAPLTEKSQKILMASAISPKIRDAGDFVFNIQPDASIYLKTLVPFLLENRKIKRWAVLHIMNDFGLDQARVFKELMEQGGAEVLSIQEYLPDTSDFRSLLSRIKASKADGLFIPGYTEVGVILRQVKELGLEL